MFKNNFAGGLQAVVQQVNASVAQRGGDCQRRGDAIPLARHPRPGTSQSLSSPTSCGPR